jgi:hypothetical protein
MSIACSTDVQKVTTRMAAIVVQELQPSVAVLRSTGLRVYDGARQASYSKHI